MTKTINDVYMQLFRRLKEGGDPMPQLTAREITAYACKADKKQTAGWSHFYVEDTTVDYAGLLSGRRAAGVHYRRMGFLRSDLQGGPFGAHSALGHRAAVRAGH